MVSSPLHNQECGGNPGSKASGSNPMNVPTSGSASDWVGYLDRQWPRLTMFLHDPLMDLTNNDVESGLRTWVLDKKTWLFVGHEASARRTADALTLLTTCKRMGIHPRDYLRDTLAKILAGEKDLTALLPETYAASLAQRAPAVAA